jgi:hypothetical protein
MPAPPRARPRSAPSSLESHPKPASQPTPILACDGELPHGILVALVCGEGSSHARRQAGAAFSSDAFWESVRGREDLGEVRVGTGGIHADVGVEEGAESLGGGGGGDGRQGGEAPQRDGHEGVGAEVDGHGEWATTWRRRWRSRGGSRQRWRRRGGPFLPSCPRPRRVPGWRRVHRRHAPRHWGRAPRCRQCHHLLARFVLHLLLSLASPPSSPPVSLPFEQPRGGLSGHPHPQPLPLHVMATPGTAMVSVAWSCPTTPLRSFVVLQSRRPRESRGRCRQSPWPCCWTVTANGHKAVFVRLLED